MLPSKTFMFAMFLAILASALVMWFRARHRKDDRANRGGRWLWLPPVASGAKLLVWSADLAEQIANRILSSRRTKSLPADLANQVIGGAGFAITHLPTMDRQLDFTDCRNRKFTRIGVTPPEVLAIADMIRPNKLEAARIHDIAIRNSKRLASESDERELAHSLSCPLRSQQGTCLASGLCPLHCRVTCDLTDRVEPQHQRTLEDVSCDIGFGVEVGLARALKSAGLDGHVYELNSALAVALETPDASEKWAKGENVFAKCMANDHTAYM